MGVKEGCGSQDGGIDMIMPDEWMEEEMLADKMQSRLFVLKMVSALHPGMTVCEYNQLFKGLSYAAMMRYIRLMQVVRKQERGEI